MDSKHVLTITVIDPDTNLPVEIEIRKNVTGEMFGLPFERPMTAEEELEVGQVVNEMTICSLVDSYGNCLGVVQVPQAMTKLHRTKLQAVQNYANLHNQYVCFHEGIGTVTDMPALLNWIEERNGKEDESEPD